MNRRQLLVAGALGGVALSTGISADAQTKKAPKAQLKVASQEGIIPGKDLPERLAKMEKWGYEGIEVGGGNLPNRVKEIRSALKNSSVKLSAICAGFKGALASDQETERQKARDTMKEILTAAGELGAVGLVFVPAFNGQTKYNHVDARKVLLEQLPELAEHAHACGTTMLLEPLNRGETWYVRQLADAAQICKEVNSPGMCMMGDFYHMYFEEPSDMAAFIAGGKYMKHVHLGSIKRKLPGQDERDFTDGFKGLKVIGYQGYCSLECGVEGDREVELPKCVKFLKDQWAKAKVEFIA